MAYNPSSVVAALRTVTEQFEAYKAAKGIQDTSAYALDSTFISRIPDMPLRTIEGDTCIAPAIVWARIQNVETPQLYPVFPWRIYGMGRPGLNTARNTYLKDPHALKMRTHIGWKQDNIWAACSVLPTMRHALTLRNLPTGLTASLPSGTLAMTAPDCNRGGAAMIGLQEMLLQEAPDGQLLLFQAWPREWNVKFRLHATGGRIVNAEIKDGKIKVETEKTK